MVNYFCMASIANRSSCSSSRFGGQVKYLFLSYDKEDMSQSGYILIVFLVVLVVGSAVWFSLNLLGSGAMLKSDRQLSTRQDMEDVKQRLLQFMVLTPEIMETDNSNTYPIYTTDQIPGPGYLPNCDTNGDGLMNDGCTTSHFLPKFLPKGISGRHLHFSHKAKQYYYVIDPRYVIQNTSYPPLNRFSPLNSDMDNSHSLFLNIPSGTATSSTKGYVALIFPLVQTTGSFSGTCPPDDMYATYTQETPTNCTYNGTLIYKNHDGDQYFYSGHGQQVIGITQEEWKRAVERRVCNLKDEMMDTDPNEPFWFNQYDATTNPAGDSWRSLVEGGLCQ